MEESIEISLKYKGEYYSEVSVLLELGGFEKLDYDLWRSQRTGNVYKFILSGSGSKTFVSRLEELRDGEYIPINTEFCDHKQAIYDYDKNHARSRVSTTTAEQVRDNLLERIRKDETVFKCINKINKLSKTKEGAAFLEYLGKDTMEFSDLLNVYSPKDGFKVISVISRKNTDGWIKSFLSPSGTLYYIYPADRCFKGYIDSVLSKKKIKSWIGDDVSKIEE